MILWSTPMITIIKTLAKNFGFRISRNHFGIDKWDDVRTILGRDPKTIFDVGANVGQTALDLIAHFPSAFVHSFEPTPDTFAKLRQAVQGRSNVMARNLALGSTRGHSAIHAHAGGEWNSMLMVSDDLSARAKTNGWSVSSEPMSVDVSVSTVDDYCREHRVDHIDLLKIDTQGYELEVLRGSIDMLSLKRVHLVFMEMPLIPLYEGQSTFDELYRFMADSDYLLSGLYDRCFDKQHAIMWCDGLFIARAKDMT